ncbi:uncharacterized protein LOC143198003 isoform X3 [Rhynchophorus ferrugineus]|uniref:uncharacterized protein LOC143198003 isoform X3 n=1 Tax=Rhynchophorus ferrugineus TaxID=354439 RepID=UPI003FCC7EBA
MERKLDKDAVSKRILETSRETERLKEELQNLIAAGIQGNLNLSVPSVSKSQHNSSNKVQIIKSYDSKHSCHPVNVMSSENEVLSPKKDKHYDVQQSREYIKKQKEKRMAEIKSKKCETKIAMELKKEKLQELHQKANEIVKKNVEAKRQRSKSREPPIMRSRSVSREGKADLRSKPKIKDSQKDSKSKSQEPLVIRSRSANRDVKTIVKSTSSNVGVKKIDNVKNKNKESKISSSHLNSGIDSEIRALSRDSIIHGYNCAGRSKKYSSSTSSMDIKPITETNIPQTCERLLNGELITTKNTNLLYPPDFQVKPLQGPEISLETQKYNLYDKCKNQLYQDSLPSYEGDTDQPISQERSRRDIFLKDVYISKQITSRKGSSKEVQQQAKPTSQSKNLLLKDEERDLTIHSNFNLKSQINKKKTMNDQAQKHDYPDWLRTSAPQTDPYNFINTVRRQLKNAISEKKSTVVDVAVQNSVLSGWSNKKNHIEIGPERSIKDGKSNTKTSSNSESDTSKNIPSISSESYTSSKKPMVAKSSSKAILRTVSPDNLSKKSYSIDEIIKPKSDFSAFETNSYRATESCSAISEKSKSSIKSVKLSEKTSRGTVVVSRGSVLNTYSGNTDCSDKENLDHLSLKDAKRIIRTRSDKPASLRNTTVRAGNETRSSNKANQIHLKFEAEIHLLNDFNKSLRHFAEIEKEFESLRSRDDVDFMTKKIVLNRDTQTSLVNTMTDTRSHRNNTSSHVLSVNYSRGTLGSEEIPPLELTHKLEDNSDLNIMELESKINETNSDDYPEKNSSALQISSHTISRKSLVESTNGENNMFKDFAGISLKMFDQLIKDEDIRIENLKKIVKIREQVLLDKTKGELVWLEMQKKQFIESKRFEDAALIKRKQRAILLKHQEERLEIQKLKQMQKETSNKRKTVLKQQRDGIKHQLHSGNMLSIKSSGRDRHERRTSGPLKVIQSSSIHSETSMAIAAETGTDHEMKSIASKTHSMVNILSTQSDHKHTELSESINASVEPRKSISDSALTNMKQKLLMREKALAKRRKTVEELLQWHQKLLREERAIEDLESQVKNIFTNIPSEKEDEAAVNVSNASYREDKPPEMSKNIPQSTKDHAEDTRSSADKYNTEFEADDGSSISSISQLIEGFNKIEDNILNFSLTYPARNQFGEQIDEVLEYEKQESVKSTSSSTSIIDSNAESLKPAVEEQVGDKSLVADSEITTDKLPQRNVCVVQPGHQESSDRDINEIEDAPEKCAIERTVPLEIDDNISEKNSTDEVSEQSDVLSAVELEKEASIQSVISSESIVNTLQPENSIVQEISITKDGSVNLEELLTSVQQPVVEDTPTVDEISIREVGGDVTTTAESHDETHSLISQLNEDAAEQIVVHEETPSTSHQTIEQVTSEDIVQNDILEDTSNSLRQYSENKTDEEKVASLSTRTPSRDQSIVVTSNEENASLRSEEKISTEEDIVVAEPGPNQSSTSSIAATEETQEDVSVSLLESCVDDVELEESCQKSLVTLGKDKTSVDAQEMLEDVNSASKSNGSTEVQEARVMTYDLLSPSDAAGFPLDEKKSFSLGNEAEELLRKQLAIEQEIKLLTEQQQKEQMSLVYMREIPNKPPPPYTPPSKTKTVKVATVIPSTKDEIQQITEYSAKIIHKAYVSNNLDNISISDKTLSLIAKNINKGCYKYVFNLCKDIAIDHYGQFLDETPGPSWMRPEERSFSFEQKPLDGNGLQQLMNKKLLELFGFQKQEVRRENAIMKWSRKKRDHVDEVLIREMQAEEKSWTNTEKDELLVKNRITNEIMDLLLRDTVQVLKKTISLKNENII